MSVKDSDFTRRGFLSATVSGMVSAGLLGLSSRKAIAQDNAQEIDQEEAKQSSSESQKKIIVRPLGKTGINLPIISMGVMNSDNPEVLKASYEIGVRHFDTAAYYQSGHNEEMVGEVVKEMGIRDKVVIATKIFTPNFRESTKPSDVPNKIISLCDESLKRLQMDYVDILYVHNLKKTGTASNEAILETMAKLKKQGKARFIGVTTHSLMDKIIDEAVGTGVYDVIETAFNFTMADFGNLLKSLANATAKGVGLIAMKTQAGSHRRSNLDFGERYSSKTVATAALKWVIQNKNITTAIPGYTTFEHMQQDFSVAYDLEYTPEEKKLLAECDVKLGMGFCRQCQVCLDTCPHGVDIPSLMRTHMYAARYSNFDQARVTLKEIPADRGIKACAACSTCIARCQNCVDITRNIVELKQMYA